MSFYLPQKIQIEHWWKELPERFEKYFKRDLLNLIENQNYDLHNNRYGKIKKNTRLIFQKNYFRMLYYGTV